MDAPREQWDYRHALRMLLKSGQRTVSVNPIQDDLQIMHSFRCLLKKNLGFISFNSSVFPLIGAIVFNSAPEAMLL